MRAQVAALEGRAYVLDAYSGATLWRAQNGISFAGPAVEAAFSPDSRYLLCGVHPLVSEKGSAYGGAGLWGIGPPEALGDLMLVASAGL